MLFVSPDRPEKLRESSKQNAFSYTLLSDSKADAFAAVESPLETDLLTEFGSDPVEAGSGVEAEPPRR